MNLNNKKEYKQSKLFNSSEWWEEYWQDMPEFIQNDLMPYRSIIVHFENRKDMELFEELVDQKIQKNSQSIWYPAKTIVKRTERWYDES